MNQQAKSQFGRAKRDRTARSSVKAQKDRLQRTVLGSARKHHLFQSGETVVVAVSGGKDSVALLDLLVSLSAALKISPVAAHLDHGIRGHDARADAGLVAAMAARLGIPFHTRRARVPLQARNRGISIEMAARDARYRFLRSVCRDVHADCIVTAHTADDQAETLILKLARGAGVPGLAAIAPVSDHHGIRLVRPLLQVSGDHLRHYLQSRRIPWREDSSNSDPAYLRNRVRAEILPLLASRLNPNIRDTLNRTAEILREENEWMQAMTSALLNECSTGQLTAGTPRSLDVDTLRELMPAALRRVLILWLVNRGCPDTAIDFKRVTALCRLVHARSGSGHVQLPDGWVIEKRTRRMTLVHAVKRAHEPPLPTLVRLNRGGCVLPQWGLRVTIEQGKGIIRPPRTAPGTLPSSVSIRAAAVGRSPLFVREWQPGDRIRPLGLQGTRKLQDIFGDAKIPMDQRNRIPLLICRNEIVWLPGYRVAQGWEVRDASDPALHIHFEPHQGANERETD